MAGVYYGGLNVGRFYPNTGKGFRDEGLGFGAGEDSTTIVESHTKGNMEHEV